MEGIWSSRRQGVGNRDSTGSSTMKKGGFWGIFAKLVIMGVHYWHEKTGTARGTQGFQASASTLAGSLAGSNAQSSAGRRDLMDGLDSPSRPISTRKGDATMRNETKKAALILALCLTLAALFVGCQSSPTDPNAGPTRVYDGHLTPLISGAVTDTLPVAKCSQVDFYISKSPADSLVVPPDASTEYNGIAWVRFSVTMDYFRAFSAPQYTIYYKVIATGCSS